MFTAAADEKKVLVMAVGNVLTGDDGLGPAALASLEAGWDVPHGVTLFEVGTPGIDLTMFIEGYEALILVDALNVKGAPGTMKTYGREALLGGTLPVVMSPHEPTMKEALMRLDFLGTCPREVLLVGVIPQQLEADQTLSPVVRAALPDVVARVVAELTRLGFAPTRKAEPGLVRLWWERTPEQRES